jgi:serine/threonine-protein kinase
VQVSFDPKAFPIGQRIADTKWVMCGVLGEGGMGIVLDVVKDPGIRGAMKMMQPRFARRTDLVALFLNEIRMTTALRHQHIVSVIDADQLPDGTPFVVTERLDGITLRKALRKLKGRGLPASLAHLITTQICDALFRAHSHTTPIVHRDLKPENVYLHQPPYEPPHVKVLDWGVAALLDGKSDVSGYMGTPLYMAPEQMRGEPVTPMADIYATGLMLYEMITGRMPWDIDYSRQEQVTAAHLSLPPIPPSRFAPWIPGRVNEQIARALAKNPADRPASAYAFASELYELQFVDDGSGQQPTTNEATVFTLSTVIDLEEGRPSSSRPRVPAEARASAEATEYGMTAPPVLGRSLEPAAHLDIPPVTRRPATLPDLSNQPNATIPTGELPLPHAFLPPEAAPTQAGFAMLGAPAPRWPAVSTQPPLPDIPVREYRWHQPASGSPPTAPSEGASSQRRIHPAARIVLILSLCVAMGTIILAAVLFATGRRRALPQRTAEPPGPSNALAPAPSGGR